MLKKPQPALSPYHFRAWHKQVTSTQSCSDLVSMQWLHLTVVLGVGIGNPLPWHCCTTYW